MNSPDKKETPYKRTSDSLISMQLLGTIAAISFGFLGFQYQSGKIVSDVTAKITEQSVKIESLNDDVKELKEFLRFSQYKDGKQ